MDQFINLGVMFNFNGKVFVTWKQLVTQCRKALLTLKSTIKQLYLNHCTLVSIFDTYVCNILNYGCEVWGSHRNRTLKRSTLIFYGMYWEFVKIQKHVWYIFRYGACLCILFIFFECSNLFKDNAV